MPRSQTLNRPLALLVAATFFMENLDGTIIQTAAPLMAVDFGVRAVDINLAMTAYLLTLAVGVPASGWLADRFGTKRVFCSAIVVFTVASLLCALSPSLPLLVAARVLQGLGGAMMVPVGRLAVLRAVDKRDLLDAIAYLTWPALLAPVIAPALGGIIADTIGWHRIFLINIPIGIVAMILGVRLVPSGQIAQRHPFDLIGFALLGVALAALVLGMEEFGTNLVAALLMVALAVLAGALGVWRMLRAAHPLLRFSALRIPTFRVGNVGGGVYRMLISAAPFVFTLMFQEGFGWSASLAGILVVAVFAGNIVIKPATSPLIRRFGFRAVIVGSNLAGAAVYVWCAFLTQQTPLAVIAVALFLSGVFRSIGFSGYNSVQFADVDPEQTNEANTLASTMQQTAAGLGIAVAALIVRLTTSVADLVDPSDPGLGYRWAFFVVAAMLLFPAIEAARLPAQAGAGVVRR
ncbi:MFS transporter [Paramicrobacterium fandaimingii]|uniref:MFS transporter n=1 Tax=Paramicrobacterium fandaimingii TaxID=2708079 RepID=UPI001422F124|nr:MFS transporter [Microbacterium fandaimingii]